MDLLELYAVGVEPLAVRMLVGEAILYLAIIVYLALLGVDEQYLSGLQTSLLGYHRRVEVHYADFRRHDHGARLGDGVSGRAQAVAVKHTTGITAVGEQQGCRAVPRLHEDGVILVESLDVLGDGVLVVEALGHHYAEGLRQRHAVHDEELEHVVKACRVAHVGLDDW